MCYYIYYDIVWEMAHANALVDSIAMVSDWIGQECNRGAGNRVSSRLHAMGLSGAANKLAEYVWRRKKLE